MYIYIYECVCVFVCIYTAGQNFGDHLILKNYKSCTDVFPALT